MMVQPVYIQKWKLLGPHHPHKQTVIFCIILYSEQSCHFYYLEIYFAHLNQANMFDVIGMSVEITKDTKKNMRGMIQLTIFESYRLFAN